MSDYPIDWKPTTLRECGNWYSGGTPSRDRADYWHGEIPWVSGKSLHNYFVSDAVEHVTLQGSKNGTRLVPAGTILILVRGMMLHKRLPVGIATREVTFNQDVKAIIPYDQVHPEFLLYWFITHAGQILNYVEESSHGTGRLPTDLLQRTIVYLPPLEEQRKIAQILSTWDEAIALVDALITALTERKKGLMQRLLTGEVRFPGFDDEWEEVRLGEVLKEVRRRADINDEQDYDLLSVRRRSEGAFYRETRPGSEIKETMYEVREDDFLISKRQIVHGASALTQEEFNGFLVSNAYHTLKAKDDNSIRFFNWLSKTPLIYHLSYISSHGIHIEKMFFVLDAYLKHKIRLPQSCEEQEKIADALDSVEVVTTDLIEYRKELREQKKGLMQRLLTGEVRV